MPWVVWLCLVLCYGPIGLDGNLVPLITLNIFLDTDQVLVECGDRLADQQFNNSSGNDSNESTRISCKNSVNIINNSTITNPGSPRWSSMFIQAIPFYDDSNPILFDADFANSTLTIAVADNNLDQFKISILIPKSGIHSSESKVKAYKSSKSPFKSVGYEIEAIEQEEIGWSESLDTNEYIASIRLPKEAGNYSLSVIDKIGSPILEQNFEILYTVPVSVKRIYYYPWRLGVSLDHGTLDDFDGILKERQLDSRQDNAIIDQPYLLICMYRGQGPVENAYLYWIPTDCYYPDCEVRNPDFDYPNVYRQLPIGIGTDRFVMAFALVANITGRFACGYKDRIRDEPFIVSDAPTGEGLYAELVSPPADQIIIGDRITIRCIINKYRYLEDRPMFWMTPTESLGTAMFFDPELYSTGVTGTPNSDIIDLFILNATIPNSNAYFCRQKKKTNREDDDSNFVNINVQIPVTPYFAVEPQSATKIKGQSVDFHCDARGTPEPKVTWEKEGDNKKCGKSLCDDHKIKFSDNNRVLRIDGLHSDDTGKYYCIAENRLDTNRTSFELKVNEPMDNTYIIIIVIFGSMALVAVSFSVFLKCKRTWQERQLKELERMLREEQEDTNDLDTNQPINDQSDQLKFDFNLEIPKENVTNTKTKLGDGAFGIVYFGYLNLADGKRVEIALKMAKDSMNYIHQKALIREMKLMMYLNHHVNILNLLGIVSKEMSKGKLCAILEYCKNGSVRKYIQTRKDTFRALYTIQNTGHESAENRKYAAIGEATGSDDIEKGCYSAVLPYATNSSDNSSSASIYEENGPLTTLDMLAFAYQIAKGMDFLASKNLIHRDLALRNVLLTDSLIIKIADYGLALREEMPTDGENHFWPIRWMPLEAIENLEFGVESDVWSFGVVLWEIFSFGALPYASLESKQQIVYFLKHGGRLEKPEHCPEEIYDLMLQCWDADKSQRPSFSDCQSEINRIAKSISASSWRKFLTKLDQAEEDMKQSAICYCHADDQISEIESICSTKQCNDAQNAAHFDDGAEVELGVLHI